VAFARIGSKIFLIDEAGTAMDLPASKKKYSFPVILGMNSNEPPSTRKARMKIYNLLVSQLDSGGAHYSQDISEVDLSDLEDVKVLANNADGNVLVHLGSSNYLERYRVYVAHVKEWRQQFDRVDSVDLRYDRQIIVNPDSAGAVQQATISSSDARKAIAASVRPVALIRHTPAAAAAATPQNPALSSGLKPAVQRKRMTRWNRQKAHKIILASRRTKTVAKPAGAQASAAPPDPTTITAKKKPSPSIAKQQ
jgi:cell division protein FtsQ